jgi:hypothetical protein
VSAFEKHRMMCGRCQLVLNVFTHPDGSKEYQHSRIWEDHDHEPIPVPATGGAAGLTCDFCGEYGPKYLYEGSADLEMRGDDQVWGFGRNWVACVACDRFLRRGDLDGLGHHCSASSRADGIIQKKLERDRGHSLTVAELASISARRDYFHRAFWSTRPRRSLIPPPPPPPAALTPNRLPRVRDRLVEYWRGDIIRATIGDRTLPEPVALPGEDLGSADFSVVADHIPQPAVDAFCDRMARSTADAELYWISTEFSSLAVGAGAKLPDLSITAVELPAPHGLVVYAEPIMSVGEGLLVVAVGWTTVPGGVWSTLYAQPEQTFPDIDREELRQRIGFLTALGPGGGLPFGLHHRPDGRTSVASRNGAAAWATVLSTWFLMSQPGVATVTNHAMDKKAAAPYRRAARPVPVVRLVDLRRQAASTKSGDGTGRTFHYSVRFVVGGKTGGFWRDQAYGPGRSLRYRRWIAPYLKGPQGAPLQPAPPVVNVLR